MTSKTMVPISAHKSETCQTRARSPKVNAFQRTMARRIKGILETENIPEVSFREEHDRIPRFWPEMINLFRRIIGWGEIPYRTREGKETSLVARFHRKGWRFVIYIYDDDASLHRDDEDFLCEKDDYDSENDLINDFSRQLLSALSEDEFKGNCDHLL